MGSQVLRCGILLTKEPDRRRFDLTLRASLINRGLSLSQLKDGSGIYGCIISAEDHGFVASLGLDGVTAFVPLSKAPKQGFKIGQPVEAVVTVSKMEPSQVVKVSPHSLADCKKCCSSHLPSCHSELCTRQLTGFCL